LEKSTGDQYFDLARKNFFDKDVVYSEIIENILFISFEILISKSTIDFCIKYGLDNIKDLKDKKDIICFYNEVYKEVEKEITSNYSKEYKIYVDL
jgi:hypothetical protein